jgi:hypothetical protein
MLTLKLPWGIEQSSLGEIWSLAHEDVDSSDWQKTPTQSRSNAIRNFIIHFGDQECFIFWYVNLLLLKYIPIEKEMYRINCYNVIKSFRSKINVLENDLGYLAIFSSEFK